MGEQTWVDMKVYLAVEILKQACIRSMFFLCLGLFCVYSHPDPAYWTMFHSSFPTLEENLAV